jgi:hypothetical protein
MDPQAYLAQCELDVEAANVAAMAAWFRGQDTNDDWCAVRISVENLRIAREEAEWTTDC